MDQHSSDPEVELDDAPFFEEMVDLSDQRETKNVSFFIGKNNETLWASKPLSITRKTRSKNIIKTIPGPKGEARKCKSQLDCFLQIISLEMIDEIVNYTNIYIAKKLAERIELSETPIRERDYKPTSMSEIKAGFGALFLIAVKRGNRADFSEYFTKDGTGLIILRGNFSERRFRLLLRSLRFDNVRTREERVKIDRLAPIREFLSKFVGNCQAAYNVGKSLTIDGMLVAFHGRCKFIQYMAQKPAKYGLKIYALCDSQTFYTYNMQVYCGTQPPGPYVTSNKPYDIVKNLIKPLKLTNRNVTTDNYFSSYSLAQYLLSVGLTFLGTLRKNKAEIPPEFVSENKILVAGNHLFGCNDDSTLISFATKKKKVVLVLSTLHDDNQVDNETGKPIQIMDYNATKGGVYTVDLMCSRISTSRRTNRWPMTIFFRTLDIAGINSMRIYQMNNPGETFPRRDYLKDLAMQLMDENLRERAKIPNLPKDLSILLKKYMDEENENRCNTEAVPNKRRFCFICGSRKNNITKLSCHTCGKSVCQKHSQHRCDNCVMTNKTSDEDKD